jgi:hypothetical protein
LNQLITSNFSPVPTVFNQFLTSIALGDVDLHFSLLLLTKAVLMKRKLNDLHDCITNVISTQLTECVTVMSLSDTLLQKISMLISHLYKIVLNRKLLRKYANCHVARCIKQTFGTEVICNWSYVFLKKKILFTVHPQLLQFQPPWQVRGEGRISGVF